ncbi:MAG: hypothetical protein E2P02_10295 [Acidobacteria bacterium]|nr:MAG: hypothetical protein E2P02_10295 [Acidobacteriota bacterium]
MKVLLEHLAGSPERKARFEREAKAISQLNHPSICTLYDVGEQNGVDFIVMEYIEGETLAERIAAGLPSMKPSRSCCRLPRVSRSRTKKASSIEI